jgi:hypothetical protein
MMTPMEQRIVRIIQANERMEDAASQILHDSGINAHFEQKIANDQVRQLRHRGICPTCGADEGAGKSPGWP